MQNENTSAVQAEQALSFGLFIFSFLMINLRPVLSHTPMRAQSTIPPRGSRMKRLLIVSFLFIFQPLLASETLWTEIEPSYQFRTPHSHSEIPHTARKMKLNFEAMKQTLTTAQRGVNAKTTIALPSPDGQLISFEVEAVSVMSPALASRYPEIQTWKIANLYNPEINGRIDIGPRGFHGLFYTSDGDRIFIDPVQQEGEPQTEIYTVLSSHENHGSADNNFTCELHGTPSQTTISERASENTSDDVRTYRLALAVTGEYTQLFGGTKAFALAGMTTTVNRLNQVFERDLNIKLELIAENDALIYTSPSSDPFSNQDAIKMVSQNLVNTNAVIGRDNYDIGHVFGTGNTGGLAFLDSTCGENKAGGVTGSNSPEGEAFNIDYVAHEIGHQLGASHTFNGYQQNCSANNRVQSTAVEPGSGSSIMGYAGICGADDLQSNSDAFFHSTSIAQIRNFTRNAGGSQCGTLTASLNNNPSVDAGKAYFIPAQTPFVLTGDSSDMDGDPLLHSWEQTDTGASSDLYSDLIDNPLFRVWKPTTEAVRYLPRLKELLNNTSILGELLPSTTRELNFSLLVRDNKGGIASDSVKLNVVATGTPFAITSNNIPTELIGGQSFNLKWDVAGTNQSPINCKSIDISFINEKMSYPPVLKETPNDGSQQVRLPREMQHINKANIKISCSDNIFFAVSKTKHSVKGAKPLLSLNSPSLIKGNDGTNTLIYTLELSAPATEETFIFYQATSTVYANRGQQIRGEVVIPVGQTTTKIIIPVIEGTVTSAAMAAKLAIEAPEDAPFEIAETELVIATEIASNPMPEAEAIETTTPTTAVTSNINGGGGAFGSLSSLALFFLLLVRLKSLVYTPTNRKVIQ